MAALGILALLVYTFGAYAYGGVLVLAIQDLGRRGWAAQRRAAPKAPEIVGGIMMLLGVIWFLANLAVAILQLGPPGPHRPLQVLVLWLAFLWPPLIMHVTLAEVRAARGPSPGMTPWEWGVRLAYPAVLSIPSWIMLAVAGVVSTSGRTADLVITLGLTASFVAASVFSVTLTRRFGPAGVTPRQRLGDRAMTTMFVVTVLLFLLLPALALAANLSLGAVLGRALEIAVRSLPLAFLVVGAYFQSRFEFVDVLVKRGLTLLVTVAALTAFFAAALPFLSRFADASTAPWVYAIAVLPVALALPWVHARISSALDRWWLGRRFSTVDAVKHFIATLRSATTEAEVVRLAEQALSDVFGGPAVVRVGAEDRDLPFDVLQEVRIRSAAAEGSIRMGPRASEAPYFSEDVALLTSLADVLASVLDNLHLQARKQEQEQRAQELSLHASRSELKALRAQINPHFLFNALNAIGGLIHRNPDRADRTIEQLADVFRYALRGAESEWTVLDDELEFVRSYLEVERARFGERLQVQIRIADEARGARVPTMMVQTLVENAVKHGVSQVLDTATVDVEAAVDGDQLVIAVTDNGEGFSARGMRHSQPQGRGGGYGLANIRQRLDGYFGEKGALTIARDEARGVTVVSVAMPLVRE